MQITPSGLLYLFNSFNSIYQSGYTSATPFWNQIATLKPSTTQQETYYWADRVARLRPWVGERQMRSISSLFQTITNVDFEDSIEVDRNKILDDTYGVYDFPIRDLGRAAAKWPDTLFFNPEGTGLLQVGQSTPCFDGANFFDTVHPWDTYKGQVTSTNQQNYWASGMGLTFDNYQTVRATMMQYKGADGLPLNVMPNLLVVPPQLEVTARLIAEANSVAPGTLGANAQVGANDNVLFNTAKVLVIPDLISATQWYLLDTSKGIKPFVFQQRQAPVQVALKDATSENVFKRKKYVFGVDTRGAAVGGLWFLAAKASA